MGAAVVTHDAGAIDAQHDRQLLNRNVMHDLVERALQERGVDAHDRPQALRGQAGGQRQGVTFGDAHVVYPSWQGFLQVRERRALQHGRAHGDDSRVVARQLH